MRAFYLFILVTFFIPIENTLSRELSIIIEFNKYKEQIDKGDFDFFLNKEYSQEFEAVDNNDGILKTIDTIKNRAKELSDDNKKKVVKYTQNLTKISLMYKGQH